MYTVVLINTSESSSHAICVHQPVCGTVHNLQTLSVLMVLCNSSTHLLTICILTKTRYHLSLLAHAGTSLAMTELVALKWRKTGDCRGGG